MSEGSCENSGTSSNYGASAGSSSGGSNSNSSSGSGKSSGTGSNRGVNRGRGNSTNTSRGYSESMEFAFEPGDFARTLRTGGPENHNLVTGVWFQGGRIFTGSGRNYMMGTFKQ